MGKESEWNWMVTQTKIQIIGLFLFLLTSITLDWIFGFDNVDYPVVLW